MASQPPSVAASATNSRPAAKPLVPPDEQFWQRYSPHHEAPLSGVGSFALHFLIGSFLLLAGYLGWLGLGTNRSAVPTDVVRLDLGGGGGDRRAEGNGPGNGSIGAEAADVDRKDQNLPPVDEAKPDRPELKQPAFMPEHLPQAIKNDDSMKRFIKEGNENLRALSNLNQSVQDKLRKGLEPAGHGKGGTGRGGGEGTGTGTGTGAGNGPGSGTMLNKREQRMLRWVMEFDTRSGPDYLRQLDGLGAILAIPKDSGGEHDYWIIRDLKSRPAKLLDEDVSSIQRIYWIDDKPQSVSQLVNALGLRKVPSHFVAFMPEELENKLFQLELSYAGRTEEEIYSTRFRVRRDGGSYVPYVVEQKPKNDRNQ